MNSRVAKTGNCTCVYALCVIYYAMQFSNSFKLTFNLLKIYLSLLCFYNCASVRKMSVPHCICIVWSCVIGLSGTGHRGSFHVPNKWLHNTQYAHLHYILILGQQRKIIWDFGSEMGGLV